MPLLDDITAALASVPELSKVLEAAKPLLAEVEAALPTIDRSEFEHAFSGAMSILAALAHPNPDVAQTLKNRAGNALGRLGRFAKHFSADTAKDIRELVSDDPAASQTVVVTPAAPVAAVNATEAAKPEPTANKST